MGSPFSRTPRFSVVMPYFDSRPTLLRAIESALGQTFGDFELILVDDGSTDGSADIARAAAARDGRVVLLAHPVNRGCAAARGTGASAARGEFVTKMDADDVLERQALEVLARTIADEPGFDIYSATGYKVYPDGSRREALNDPRFFEPCSLDLDDLLDDCWIFGGAATIRRDTLERVGGFRPEMRCEDWDLWLRALAAGATHRYVPEHIYLYSMDLPGRMNEHPERSFRSYLVILDDLIGSGVISGSHARVAERSKEKFRKRIAQLEESGVTDAEFTDAQARRFKQWAYRTFGEAGGRVAIKAADKVKWVVKPLRLAAARRHRRRSMR